MLANTTKQDSNGQASLIIRALPTNVNIGNLFSFYLLELDVLEKYGKPFNEINSIFSGETSSYHNRAFMNPVESKKRMESELALEIYYCIQAGIEPRDKYVNHADALVSLLNKDVDDRAVVYQELIDELKRDNKLIPSIRGHFVLSIRSCILATYKICSSIKSCRNIIGARVF